MKAFFWIIGLCLWSWNLYSSSVNTNPVIKENPFLGKWLASALHTKDGKESKIFKRFTKVGGHIFNIASVTYFKIEKTKGDKLERHLPRQIERAFGGENWQIKRKGENLLVEGLWQGGNRYLRYIIHETSKEMIVTVASMRNGYADGTKWETRLIQEAMILSRAALYKKNRNKKTTLYKVLLEVIPTAHAGTDFGGFFGNLPEGSNGQGQGESFNPSDLAQSMDEFSSSFDDLSVQLETSNANLAAATVEMGRSNDNWEETNRVTDKNWEKSNQVMDKNWSETNRQFARSNDIAEKMTDPNHMFKLAAATSAGAVFGATLANLAIDGVVAGARWVWDLVTDTSGKKKRWEKFEAARKGWEKTLDNARKLERLLDDFLSSQEFMKQISDSLSEKDRKKLSRENLVSFLSRDVRKLKKRRKKLEAVFETTTNPRCEDHLAYRLDEVEKMISTGEGLKHYLDRENFKIYNDQLFCDNLMRIMRKLGEAEAQLQSYRLNILNARIEWAEQNEERTEDLFDVVKRLNKRGVHEDFYEQRIENEEDMYEELEEAIEAKREAWVRNCEVHDPKWEKHPWDEDDNDNWKITQKCENKYKAQYGERDKQKLARNKAAMKRKIELAKRDLKKSEAIPVEINAEAEDQRLLAHYQWFKDLEEQQHCFTNPDEKECLHKSKLKFMGPFYVKDRAKVKLQDICGMDNYDY